ncbi:MAG TPA: hypothetical protein VGB95_03160, partial [Chitinophagales bacterium]
MITNSEIFFEKTLSADKAGLKKAALRQVQCATFLLLFSTSYLYAQDSTSHRRHHEFSTVTIRDSNENFGINRLKAVDGTAIY